MHLVVQLIVTLVIRLGFISPPVLSDLIRLVFECYQSRKSISPPCLSLKPPLLRSA